ncbi:MAG TPA: SpoIIE family protein phosphatase [Candidatus Acidoferrales bacterium]|nr:SpoIIE family protein phosphatase [Candidatus Acidoferrales bacterium]
MSTVPRPVLIVLALLFAVSMILYSSLWMYAVRHRGPSVELGFDSQYSTTDHCSKVQTVEKGGPAEQAGLQVGDRILALDGKRVTSSVLFDEVWLRSRPGDSIQLTVERPGEPKTLILCGTFRAATPHSSELGLARKSALQVIGSYPVPFVVVGLAVLFLRTDDPNAWLLALLFCGFIAVPEPISFVVRSPPLQSFFIAYRTIFLAMFGALFYLFFAIFPTRSPMDRHLPWLKWLAFLLGVCIMLPGLRVGTVRAPAVLVQLIGEAAASKSVLFYIYLFVALGFISLVGNASRASTSEACRRSRVILWGTLVGVLPIAAEKGAIDFAGYRPPFWLDTILVVVTFLFPLSFAYAVVRHRVLEIPVLLKRSARYVLVQRGYIVLLFVGAATAIAFFARTVSRFFPADTNIGMGLSAVFGIVMVWASAPLVKRGTQRIDRAFFRSAYDARVILQDLAERARTVTDRHELAILLEKYISGALHPKALACYLEAAEGILVAECGQVPTELHTLGSALPLLSELERRGKAWEVPPLESEAGREFAVVAPLAPECLVPILGRSSRLVGMLALGQRLSEEPYSGEDKRLLDSVASQAGIALENIRLAEKMAERMEAERRAAREMEIAREVQARLFPQTMPPLRTLEYAGGCVQARDVGGDYYDFLDLGPGRVGIVLADIAGKGISGALLMANLQANLRSQYAIALEDLPRLLKSVNRLFVENTPDDSYATLFFGDYNDATRCLRYANCGHNAPLLFRKTGKVERLVATTTVLGLFSDWECATCEVALDIGDTLVIYTDGITEAVDRAGEEFGEARLIELICAHRHLSPRELLTRVHAAVQQLSTGIQADDLTLVIGRVH